VTVTTWHYGLIARWWAEFNHGGDDIDFFRRQVEKSGDPVLDAGCGTGRVLRPLLEAGFRVDGADASAEMLDWCAKDLAAHGLRAHLTAQPMHHLDLETRYRTIIVCGAFGLGGTPANDLEGLRRLHDHLQTDGVLVLDHHLPNFDKRGWQAWVDPPDLPGSWPERGDRRVAKDGSELEIKTRQVAFDPLEQTTTLEIRASQFRNDELIARDEHQILINLYLKNEVALMLRSAGFEDIDITTLTGAPPKPWHDERIVFIARKRQQRPPCAT
jgi:cyclopropane fatty-acyl-phospholipid synthase-like methyltransferase